ncbi:hypothetical protein [Rhizorhabdus sp. FW153]|uniref:hypothetical protein n=1 Tax=Rhizorhabdus sp. FW153 TaxID=3400216 RepID=UPI003CF5C772
MPLFAGPACTFAEAGPVAARLDATLRDDEALVTVRAAGGGGASTIVAGAGRAMTGVLVVAEAVGVGDCTEIGAAVEAVEASPGDCWSIGAASSTVGALASAVLEAAAVSGAMAGVAISSDGASCAKDGVADRARTAAIAARPGRTGLIAYLMTRQTALGSKRVPLWRRNDPIDRWTE